MKDDRYSRRGSRYRGGEPSPIEILHAIVVSVDPKMLGSEYVRQMTKISERIEEGETREAILLEMEAKRKKTKDPDSLEILDMIIKKLNEQKRGT